MNTTNKLSVGIVIILALAFGFGGGFFAGKMSVSSDLKADLEKAKTFFPEIREIRSLSGKVKKVDGNTLTLEVQQLPNPFDEWPLKREVIAGENTKIIKNEQKDPEEYNKEMEEYGDKIKNYKPGSSPEEKFLMPPIPFKEVELSVSDIKEGDQISVESSENIKTAKRFEAVRITVFGASAFPASAGGAIPPALSTPPGIPGGTPAAIPPPPTNIPPPPTTIPPPPTGF